MDLFEDVLQTLPHPNPESFMINTISVLQKNHFHVKNVLIYMELVTELNKYKNA